MPWENITVEKLRKEFIIAARSASNFSALCREFNISRRTGYKWLNRQSVADLPRAPKSTPTKTSSEIENLILSVRQDNQAWGGKTIRKVLQNQGYVDLPCAKTCNNILKRNNCIDPIESLKHKPYIRYQKDFANEMWQTDFKGDFPLLDGKRCFPLNIIDDCTRFSIIIHPKHNTKGTKETFHIAFSEYGLPKSVLSDNGPQFSGFRGGYTLFERWLMELDVLPLHGRIMHPQTQGKIERFHRSMKYELLNFHEFYNLEHADTLLQEWRYKYNNIRPHEALNMKCPADVYVPSEREYDPIIKNYEYDSIYHIVKVNSWGYLRFANWQTYLSETMANTYVEVRPNEATNSFTICFRNYAIAEINASDGKLINRKISRL